MDLKKVRGAKAWVAKARETSLPILKQSARTLTRQIKSGAALAELAATVERDPALSLHLFVAANQASHELNEETDILSLTHVMSVLGMQGVIDIVKQQKQITPKGYNAYENAYQQAQANSLFAAHLADFWSAEGKLGSPEKLKWATLLSGTPNWLLWRCAYPELRHWEWWRLREHKPLDEIESRLFGAHLSDLQKLLGRYFKLPNLSQSVLDPKALPSIQQWAHILSPRYLDYFDADSALKLKKRDPAVLMALCLYMADAASKGWYQPHALRAQRALSHILGIPLEKVGRLSHRLAVNFSRQFHHRQSVPPAFGLLWPEDNQPWLRVPIECVMTVEKEPPKAVVQPQIEDTRRPMKKAPPRAPDTDLMLQLIQRFHQQAHSFKDVHDILLTCNKAINSGLGMRRTCIFVLSKSADSLRPVYCVGVSADSPFRTLRIAMEDNRFFAKLIERSASFKVDSANFNSVKKMLSDEVLAVFTNKDFITMSLFANGKPIGVVYADASSEEDTINDREYQTFKKICQSASYALDNYAKKRRRAS